MQIVKDALGTAVNWLNGVLESILAVILILLPQSPFRDGGVLGKSAFVKNALGYVNYYIPFAAMTEIMAAWLSAIVVWYTYSVILRWIKAIQ